MSDSDTADDKLYWIAVWILPIAVIVTTFLVYGLVSNGYLAEHWYPRFGAICVVTGIWAEGYLLGPRYEFLDGWFVPKNPPSRKGTRYWKENVLLGATIVNGTVIWGFGDLLL